MPGSSRTENCDGRPLMAALGGHQNAAERTLQLNSGRTSRGIYAATARDISSGAAAYPLQKHHLGIAVVQVFNDASLREPRSVKERFGNDV